MVVRSRRWETREGDTGCLGVSEWYGCDGGNPIYKMV